MANTTNFGWETPDDTDLVKDGAAAMRTLGNAIDTSLVDLKGGTSGQVLSKASNTDMDFTWVEQDDSNAIQNAIVDAKGDLIAASAADTPARLAVGTNNTRLVAASAETTGLKWVADTQNTVIDAEGDLLVGDSADTLQRLAIGTTGQILTCDTTIDGKIKWAAAPSSIPANDSATVATNQTTTSTTYGDLTTSGPAVTVTTGTKALVILTAYLYNNTVDRGAFMSFDISGATTTSASDAKALYFYYGANDQIGLQMSAAWVMTLTAGSNTFTAKYKRGGASGTAQFSDRNITVINLA